MRKYTVYEGMDHFKAVVLSCFFGAWCCFVVYALTFYM